MELHPGYIDDDEIVKAPDCGCRIGHWCARHAAKAAWEAGQQDQQDQDEGEKEEKD